MLSLENVSLSYSKRGAVICDVLNIMCETAYSPTHFDLPTPNKLTPPPPPAHRTPSRLKTLFPLTQDTCLVLRPPNAPKRVRSRRTRERHKRCHPIEVSENKAGLLNHTACVNRWCLSSSRHSCASHAGRHIIYAVHLKAELLFCLD
jgi:hypothetical protein